MMVTVVDDDQSEHNFNDTFDSASHEEYIPMCNDVEKPFVGRKFPNLKDAELFYKSYGAQCGFDIRLGQMKKSSDGTVVIRYVYCNREGVKTGTTAEDNSFSSSCSSRRRRVSTRVSCKARIIVRFCGRDGYVVDVFKEGHTHDFVSESSRHFMKCNKQLDTLHMNFIVNCAKANIGPMKSFRLFKEISGSYKNIGCSSVEFKNFNRDLRAYVEGVDAQILLDKFHNKREISSDFTFDYCVSDSEKLTRLFWADPVSIKMYKAFGEAVSFDATYSTNRYNMIFAPFTGKDSHGRCVTFAAGLLSREDVDSYIWILQKFVDCMKKKPNMLITDQDPALKIAVERVMPETAHRFCMWHIMLKVADKIPVSVSEDEGFSQKFNDIVWSEFLQPKDFEDRWKSILEEYGLSANEWFATMFDLRKFWIPAYFKDIAMAGLFRTTSMSESENSFFRKYNNKNANLLHFMMHFDSAIEAQRDKHEKFISIDESSSPVSRTDCLFEKHAASIYTGQTFAKVQKDMKACSNACSIVNISRGPDVTVYDIDDSYAELVFKVEVSISEENFVCECKHFLNYGLLCRHIYAILRNMRARKIPDKYIMPRWTKYACSKDVLHLSDDNTYSQKEKLSLLNQLHRASSRCIGTAGFDVFRMKGMLKELNDLNEKYKQHISTITDGKQDLIENFYGSSLPDQVCILPPDQVKTKGSGSRLKSRKEKEIRDARKPLRRCSKCKKMVHHDARNCDMSV